MRPVDAELIRRAVDDLAEQNNDSYIWVPDVFAIIDDAPTLIPEEPRGRILPHGHWIYYHNRDQTAICSRCHVSQNLFWMRSHDFCPNCGARMDEVIDDADD